jgi:hypothetical protein
MGRKMGKKMQLLPQRRVGLPQLDRQQFHLRRVTPAPRHEDVRGGDQ